MFVSPIIERELLLAVRKHKVIRARFVTAAIAVGIVIIFLLFGWVSGNRSLGRNLHAILFYAGLYFAIIPPLRISVGLFSEEQRNQTLELLFLAGLNSAELFLGKLLGGALVASSELIALSPVLAVPFLTGGISLDLFLATVALFPSLLFFVISVGVLASVLCKDDGSALICAVFIGAITCLATPVPFWMGKLVAGGSPFSAGWLTVSPAFGPYLVSYNFAGSPPQLFWKTTGITLLWAVLCLLLATLLLKRNWRRDIEKTFTPGWRVGVRARIYGTESWRKKLRQRLLDINPFQWLIEQDRRPVVAAWGILAGVTLLWLVAWLLWPHAWPSTINFFVTVIIMISAVELIMVYTAARRVGEDRRGGVFELLLTTPLSPEQIVVGETAALRALFRPVRYAIFGLCLLLLLGGLFILAWTPQGLISYLIVWNILLWWSVRSAPRAVSLAMWIGMNTGRAASAIFRRQNRVWWIAMIFNFRNFARGFGGGSSWRFPNGSTEELVFVCLGAFITLCIAAFVQMSPDKMRNKLIAEFRSIAREPVPDPHDPRLKKWNIYERIPRSSYEEMSERVRVYPQRTADRARLTDPPSSPNI